MAKKVGRPSEYTVEMADRICAAIASGGNLNQIASKDGVPSREAIYTWLREKSEFSDKYARAREDRADWRSDRIDDIVRRMIDGEIDANVARVAIDAEKWQAGKEKPKGYGDKITVGGDAESPLAVVMEAGKTLDAKLDRLIARKTETD